MSVLHRERRWELIIPGSITEPEIKVLLFWVWSTHQQHGHHLGVCWKNSISHPIPKLLNQSLHFSKSPQMNTYSLKLRSPGQGHWLLLHYPGISTKSLQWRESLKCVHSWCGQEKNMSDSSIISIKCFFLNKLAIFLYLQQSLKKKSSEKKLKQAFMFVLPLISFGYISLLYAFLHWKMKFNKNNSLGARTKI